nr:MAG TPA: hypothetical protein [Caudoviricetes sp.]DAN59662.1 MAG TPA: hypothetical protein [Caudoviricetes sp.]
MKIKKLYFIIKKRCVVKRLKKFKICTVVSCRYKDRDAETSLKSQS